MNKYYFFLDETGNHNLNFIDPDFPLFLLAGCLFSEEEKNKIEKRINDFKKEFFNTTDIILHSREIRKCEGSFQILFNLDLKKKFYERLNGIMTESKFSIISSSINKENFIKRYGRGTKDPYKISLSFVLERLISCLDKEESESVDIKIEKRGRKEDNQLLEQYHIIKDRGTLFVSRERFREKINDFDFISKKANIIGLQIADLCAYPLARYVLNNNEPYIPFQIIKNKIYCDDKGNFNDFGLKIFP